MPFAVTAADGILHPGRSFHEINAAPATAVVDA
jgi:hypothetical protein